jgi:hypothetical protein
MGDAIEPDNAFAFCDQMDADAGLSFESATSSGGAWEMAWSI